MVTNMRIVCCDDDTRVIEQLRDYLQLYFKKISTPFPEFASFSSGEELVKYNQQVDIAFLDVEMAGLSGIHTGAELKRKNPNIIIFIVTSYPDYLDEAMRFHVFRYLSKPIDKNRLFRNMKDALLQYSTVSKKIQIETKDQTDIVYMKDIVFVEARERKVFVYTQKTIYESVQKMQFWSKKLPQSCFFQTHRSYIVNLRYVSRYDNSLVNLCNNKYRAYLTRRKYNSFKNAYIMYLESMR